MLWSAIVLAFAAPMSPMHDTSSQPLAVVELVPSPAVAHEEVQEGDIWSVIGAFVTPASVMSSSVTAADPPSTPCSTAAPQFFHQAWQAPPSPSVVITRDIYVLQNCMFFLCVAMALLLCLPWRSDVPPPQRPSEAKTPQ